MPNDPLFGSPRNRSMLEATVIPVLHYPVAGEAAEWLCRCFGFNERLRIGTHRVQLEIGSGGVVVTSMGGAAARIGADHSVMVRTQDVDAHCEFAAAQGARIVSPPQTQPYGERQYTAADLSGHMWTFSQSVENVDPGTWGGEPVAKSVAALPSSSPIEVVREFWRLMESNDFHSVAAVLASEFVLEWPQSKERLRGADRFARVNHEYPAHGAWRFKVRRLIGNGADVVSEVEITDGVQEARAISFFTIADGKITHLVEYWPEPYLAAGNRTHLVETDP